MTPVLRLRPMVAADLPLVDGWLRQPHVARWWLDPAIPDSHARELADCADSVAGRQPTEVLLVLQDERPVGWCQWYRCADYPDHATAVGARPGEVGVDYAVGEPDQVGHGIGSALVAALVRRVTAQLPDAGFVVDVDEQNPASRRVLERNGFTLVDVRLLPDQPDRPQAVYRRPGAAQTG